MRRIIVFLYLLPAMILPTAAPAQDRQGVNRPSDWVVTHYETHGIWNAICDERDEDAMLVQRCYIRHVDVFSPRPAFAAMFLFITPDQAGDKAEFGTEPGTIFAEGGFRIEADGVATWQTRQAGCLTGLYCGFDAAGAAELIAAMKSGGALRFTFTDRHGAAQDLTWPLDGFAEAFAAYDMQARARDLR